MTNKQDYREPYLPHSSQAMENIYTTIDASNQTLLRQAPMTADEYLRSAIDHIDQQLGKGYAKTHPELIAVFMQTSAMDMGTAIIARAIESLAAPIGEITEQIAGIGAHLADEETAVFVRLKEKDAP